MTDIHTDDEGNCFYLFVAVSEELTNIILQRLIVRLQHGPSYGRTAINQGNVVCRLHTMVCQFPHLDVELTVHSLHMYGIHYTQ